MPVPRRFSTYAASTSNQGGSGYTGAKIDMDTPQTVSVLEDAVIPPRSERLPTKGVQRDNRQLASHQRLPTKEMQRDHWQLASHLVRPGCKP
ncbi:unnamed protein product [Gadus morhua 'NCC']